MQMADHLAADGFRELGYTFVNIDVCPGHYCILMRVFFNLLSKSAHHS